MLRILAGLILVLSLGSVSVAADLDKTVLTISGKIGSESPIDLSIRQLKQLSGSSVSTSTPWHDGEVTFEGVLLSTLMNHVGATGQNADLVALNEYRSTLPISDFQEHRPLLAFIKDGSYMTIRDKGPLFVIYPFDDKPELKTEVYFSRSVWQVRTIEIR